MTFCTGGIRCEKVVPLLKKHKFKSVFQLSGGILSYLESYAGDKNNQWEGECFVFDKRVSVDKALQRGSYFWCKKCGQPCKENSCVVCGKLL